VQWRDRNPNMGVKKRLKIAERRLIGGRKKDYCGFALWWDSFGNYSKNVD
jgi:hypothetical protein